MHGLTIPWTEDTAGCTFNIYRNTVNDFPSATRIATGVPSSPYQDTTGVPGTEYVYWTTAVVGGIESGPSNLQVGTFPVTPDVPVEGDITTF